MDDKRQSYRKYVPAACVLLVAVGVALPPRDVARQARATVSAQQQEPGAPTQQQQLGTSLQDEQPPRRRRLHRKRRHLHGHRHAHLRHREPDDRGADQLKNAAAHN